jgi:cytochrome c556
MIRLLVLATVLTLTTASPGSAQIHQHETPQPKRTERQPLYLLPMMAEHQKQNMREHLAAVNEVIAALAKNDFPAVRASAAKLGTTPEMQQMCMHMGAATPGFSQRALAFHSAADSIIPAAERKDSAGVLKALHNTLDTCVSCHESYRQEVVDQVRWDELTASH